MKKLTLTLLMVAIMLCSVFVTGMAAGKVLHMYTAFDTEEAKYYIDAFEKETGIDVEWVRMSSGEVLARIEAESANPQASMWHAGSNTSHINAAAKGLLEPYKPNTDFELIDILHAEDWAWTGFYTGAIGFVSNVNFLKEHNVKAPTTWSQLLDPAFSKWLDWKKLWTGGKNLIEKVFFSILNQALDVYRWLD